MCRQAASLKKAELLLTAGKAELERGLVNREALSRRIAGVVWQPPLPSSLRCMMQIPTVLEVYLDSSDILRAFLSVIPRMKCCVY